MKKVSKKQRKKREKWEKREKQKKRPKLGKTERIRENVKDRNRVKKMCLRKHSLFTYFRI